MFADILVAVAGAALPGAAVAWLFIRQPYAGIALLWLLIPMASRIASSLYIDLSGPLLSEQVLHYVGPGRATGLLGLDFALVIAIHAVVLARRPTVVSPSWIEERWPGLGQVAYGLALGFVILLYLDLLRIGTIPLFSGLERYVYARDYAGVLHKLLLRFGDVLAVYLGVLFVLPRRHGASPDVRFLYLLIALLAYAFLTGHRYSAFFKFCTLFALPCALLSMLRDRRGPDRTMPRSLAAVLALLLAATAMVGYALFNSYFSIRFDDAEDPVRSLTERVFVQQAELWALTYQRVVVDGAANFEQAFDFLFNNPIDAGSNTSPQYLMYLALGSDAIGLVDSGQKFAGGYPEIFHELFGPVGGLLAVTAMSFVSALLVRAVLAAAAAGRLLTVFWAALVLYPFQIMYWGGMLNFVLAWTFWVKAAGFLSAWILEPRMPDRSYRTAHGKAEPAH